MHMGQIFIDFRWTFARLNDAFIKLIDLSQNRFEKTLSVLLTIDKFKNDIEVKKNVKNIIRILIMSS